MSDFPGLLHQFGNFLTGSIKVAAFASVSLPPLCPPVYFQTLCLYGTHSCCFSPYLFSLFFLSFHLSRSSPPPSSLSPALGHGTCCSLLQTVWAAGELCLFMLFFFFCARLQLFFLWGGMSVLNHMISPNDKPSLCNPATYRQGSYVGWWRGTWRNMTMHKILFLSNCVFFCRWSRGKSALCRPITKRQGLSGSLKEADCN